MKKHLVFPICISGRLLTSVSVLLAFFMLEGCCVSWCGVFIKPSNEGCQKYCDRIKAQQEGTWDYSKDRNNPNNTADSMSNSQNKISNSKSLPVSGEYFSTILSGGASMNFKSSEEDYGGSYGSHDPGVGFHLGVGTVLPFNERWALAPALRYTQKNASETISYSGTGGTGGEEYKDNYSYSYIGGMILGQYRAGKKLSIVAGPEINYLVGASMKSGGSSGTGDKESLTSSSAKLGFDLLAGVKYELGGGNGRRSRWGLSLMYDHRLSRLNEKQMNGYDVPAYHMKSVVLGVNYFICGSCGKK